MLESPPLSGSVGPLTSYPSIQKSEVAEGTECRDTDFDHEEKSPWVDPGQDDALVSAEEPVSPPPDGGLVAWTQVLMGHLVMFNTWGFVNSFGIFQTYYDTHLELPPSNVSWIGSIQIFLLFFIGIFSGRATDAGYFRHLLIIGSALQVLGIFMTSLATRYWQIFLAQGVAVGIADGILVCPCLAVVTTYFLKRRAMAMALVLTGSATGGITFPLVAQALLPRIGFPWTMRVIGFIALATSTVAGSFMRQRLPPRKLGPIVDWRAFRELPYLLFSISMLLIFMGLYFAFYYGGSFGKTIIGISYKDSITVIVIMNGAGIPGRLVPGYLADRWFGCLNVEIAFCCLTGVTMFCWIPVSSYASLLVFSTLYGFFGAGVQSLFAATLASLSPDASKTGVRLGMVFSFISVAGLTGEPVAGAIIQASDGSYVHAQIYAGCLILTGTLILVGSRIAHTGWKFKFRI